MSCTFYPVTLHGCLSRSETSSCLWVGNQWQTQLMRQQLTVVNEHNKAPQNLYQLYLLLFYCLYQFGVFVTDFTVSSLWCFCYWKIFSSLTALSVCCLSQYQTLSFSTILINVTKSIPGQICMVTILKQKKKGKYFSRDFSPFHCIHVCYSLPNFSCKGYQGLFHWQNSTAPVA
jgi:hypothetical protein